MAFFKIAKQPGEESARETTSPDQNYKEGTVSLGDSQLKIETKPLVPSGKHLSLREKKGTITITVSTTTVPEIARFQIADPALFQRTIDIIAGVLPQIDDPQVEISGDCSCIWCQQKIAEFREGLSS